MLLSKEKARWNGIRATNADGWRIVLAGQFTLPWNTSVWSLPAFWLYFQLSLVGARGACHRKTLVSSATAGYASGSFASRNETAKSCALATPRSCTS